MSKVLSSVSSSSGNLAPKREFVNHSDHLSRHFQSGNEYVVTEKIELNLDVIAKKLKGSISRVDRCKAALSVLVSQFFNHVSQLDSVNYRTMAGELMGLRRTHNPTELKIKLDEKAAHKVPELAEAFTKLGRIFRFMQEIEKLDSGFCYDKDGDGVAKTVISDSIKLLRLLRKHGVNMRNPQSVSGTEGFNEESGLTIRQGNFVNQQRSLKVGQS